MTLQWDFENRRFAGEGDIGILHLRGYIGHSALAQFTGALDWALSRSSGPIVIDLTHLHGCSDTGGSAIWDAAHHIADQHRPVSICGTRGLGISPPSPAEHDRPGRPVRVRDDLTAALAAVHLSFP